MTVISARSPRNKHLLINECVNESHFVASVIKLHHPNERDGLRILNENKLNQRVKMTCVNMTKFQKAFLREGKLFSVRNSTC